jgi:hypothetical protein
MRHTAHVTEEHRIVEGEMFGAPVPRHWPGGGRKTDEPQDEQVVPRRVRLLDRIARLLGLRR